MKKTVLRKYAQLIAQTGVNVQPGQEVFIAADLDQPEFVKMLVEECYKRRAKKVVVDWSYQPLQKLHYRYRTLTTLSKLDNYEEARWQHYVDTIPCRIYLLSEDPDGLKGINQEKMAKTFIIITYTFFVAKYRKRVHKSRLYPQVHIALLPVYHLILFLEIVQFHNYIISIKLHTSSRK